MEKLLALTCFISRILEDAHIYICIINTHYAQLKLMTLAGVLYSINRERSNTFSYFSLNFLTFEYISPSKLNFITNVNAIIIIKFVLFLF